jgi:hypothetical protein
MDDKKWLEKTVGNIFGGKLVELNENSYKISIRVYDEDNKASLKLKKNDICVFYTPITLKIDVFGRIMNYIDNNAPEIKSLENKLWEILI